MEYSLFLMSIAMTLLFFIVEIFIYRQVKKSSWIYSRAQFIFWLIFLLGTGCIAIMWISYAWFIDFSFEKIM